MADIQHSALIDPYIHEPKGVYSAAANSVYVATGGGSGSWSVHPPLSLFAGATAGQVFIADGAGSGTYSPIHKFIGAYVPFNAASPYAYSHTATTSDTLLDPTFVSAVNMGFTIVTSPNARISYTDSTTVNAQIVLSMSSQQATGAGRDVEWGLFKNNVEIVGSRSIRTISTSNWGSITVIGITNMITGDYIEIKSKANIGATVNYASLNVSILGVIT